MPQASEDWPPLQIRRLAVECFFEAGRDTRKAIALLRASTGDKMSAQAGEDDQEMGGGVARDQLRARCLSSWEEQAADRGAGMPGCGDFQCRLPPEAEGELIRDGKGAPLHIREGCPEEK